MQDTTVGCWRDAEAQDNKLARQHLDTGSSLLKSFRAAH